jgi:hypothetical protein
MFKLGLLTSTAMTAVALLLSGAPTGAYAQTDMHVASQDPNTRFLCTYGKFLVSAYSANRGSSDWFAHWTDVAVPVIGHGQTVTSIRVIEAAGSVTYNSSFSAGIYSNTASGYPGNLIAGGKGRASRTCGRVKIPISPTTLKPKTRYWIVEATQAVSNSSSNTLYWIANPNTKRKAYVKYRHFGYSSGSSYSTPWTEQPMGPYLNLRQDSPRLSGAME